LEHRVFFAHYEDGAVSVPYYRAGDAAHEGSPDAAKASVTHDYQAGVQFLTELDDLLIRLPKREVCVLDHSSLGLYSLRLLVHEIPSVVLRARFKTLME
jgi:hypothetical protein